MPPPSVRLCFASRNEHKVRELAVLCADLGLEVVAAARLVPELEVEETGQTFLDNAALKARAVALATGIHALADDSGLEVDALGGAPGVWSARYAGSPCDDARNNARLLDELRGVPAERRTARYRAAVVLAAPDGTIVDQAEGRCEGRILEAPRGTGGFGYDPLFLVPELGRTMAELPMEEKNTLSHRARALAALRPALERLGRVANPGDRR